MDEKKWYLRTKDETFGPETEAKLVEWAKMGRIQPGQEISDDNVIWQRVEEVPFLDMRYSIDIGDGNPRGPFHKAAAEALLASGRLPPTSSIVEVREPFPDAGATDVPEPEPVAEPAPAVESEPVVESIPAAEPEPVAESTNEQAKGPDAPADVVVEQPDLLSVEVPPAQPQEKIVEKVVEKIVVKEVKVEVPVEKVVVKEVRVEVPVERIVEVPVERIVEKEVRIEVPVEKIVEKIVVDETRVKELEGFLEEERRHTADLQQRLDENSRNAADAAKAAVERESALRSELGLANAKIEKQTAELGEAAERESKSKERIQHLEGELQRLPQAASEVADIQAAIYTLLKSEAEELDGILAQEKRELEEIKRRYVERSDRLMERRRTMLKRAGADVEDMTRKALLERPEDPRAAQLRKDLIELRHEHDRAMLDRDAKIRELTAELRQRKADGARISEGMKDVTQLHLEVQSLKERLQVREKELMVERQRNEELCRQQATKQQALLARLAQLESPSIGSSATVETNQSREARQVKLPGWMRLKR